MQRLKTLASSLSNIFEYIAVAGIMAMVLVNCADVLGSKLFSWPVPGSTELVSLIQLTTIAFALGATQKIRGHINVEMFISRLTHRKKAITMAFTSLLECIIFGLLIYESVHYGYSLQLAKEVSGTIKIPIYPFAYVLALCLCPVLLLVFFDHIASLKEVFKHES